MFEPAALSEDSASLLRTVLADALRRTWSAVAVINARHQMIDQSWAIDVREAWIRSLCSSFWDRYRDPAASSPRDQRFAVFGGKPLTGDGAQSEPRAIRRRQGVPSGIFGWHLWEFLHDVAVVEVGRCLPGYHKDEIVFVKRAIWQVESEVTNDGSELAKDVSKLRVSVAENKLLIARQTTQDDWESWLRFIGRLVDGMTGPVFLGLMPSYSSKPKLRNEAQEWHDCTTAIELYRCATDGSVPQFVCRIVANRMPDEAAT